MQELLGLLERELGEPVAPDTPLVSTGIVDSLRFAALLAVLAERFGIVIEPEEVGADNFDTPAQILAWAESRR